MKSLALIISLLVCLVSFGQKSTLSGYIKDKTTGEFLFSTGIYCVEAEIGTRANEYGFYSLSLKPGTYKFIVKYPGYQSQSFEIDLNDDVRLNIDLVPENMEELVIKDTKTDENVKGTDMGKVSIDIEQVKVLPAFMGEVDILKTVQFLPGVQSAGEGNSGFYVRGGGPDQNLILLDEATVYNASHLFGFFSVFNADAISGLEITKGGMTANYGGRLSSVLDIKMKEGNYQKFHMEGGLGLISSRLTLQGPIKKDTSSFIVSARRTYIDVLMKPFIPEDNAFNGSGYYFYDLNAKVNYRFSDKDRLYLSGYLGNDVFTYNNDRDNFNVRIPWGNATGSLRWNHLFTDKLFVNTTAIYSDYNFEFQASQSQFEFALLSGIRDVNLKSDFTYYPSPRHNVKFGYNYVFHTFTPSSVSARSEDVEFFDEDDVLRIYANEGAIYFMDDFDVTERLRLNLGYRHSIFQQIGPFTRYIPDPTNPLANSEVKYGRGESVQVYHGPEPRFSMRYSINDSSSIKLGAVHNYQYVHLATISPVSLPTDVWFPSSELVKPQINTQVSAGYFRNFKDNTYEASVEVYYKDMKNLIEYKEGAEPADNVNDNVDNNLTFGQGYSYGAEFFVKKSTGKLTGWVGYTWSKTMRQFDEINEGREFPARYDRRHDLSAVASYKLNDRWTFGAAFVYATGSAITLAQGFYIYEGQIQYEFGDRNSLRMPAFHRADISATYYTNPIKKKVDKVSGEVVEKDRKIQSNWNFSIYNLYNRANPYFIYIDQDGDIDAGTLTISGKQVSLFPILPSVTWNFKF